jgi:hypothetical protein
MVCGAGRFGIIARLWKGSFTGTGVGWRGGICLRISARGRRCGSAIAGSLLMAPGMPS